MTNHGSAAVTVPAGQSGPNLVPLNQAIRHGRAGPDRASRLRRGGRHVQVRRRCPTAATLSRVGRGVLRPRLRAHGRLLEAAAVGHPAAVAAQRHAAATPTASPAPARRSTTPTRPRSSTPGSCRSASRRSPAPTTTTGCSTTTCPASWPTGSSSATSPTRRTCCWSAGSRSDPTSTRWAPTGTGTAPWRTPLAWADVPRGRPTTPRSSASTSTTTRTGRASGGRACTR